MSFAQLKWAYHSLKGWSQRYRWPLTTLGAVVLVAGVALSVLSLDFDPAQMQPAYLALLALTLIPAGMVVGALNLQLMARVVGTKIGFRTAIAVTAYGRIAEVLPIPGRAVVRGAALMQSGAKMGETVSIMVWSSLLSLAMVGLCASVPLTFAYPAVGGIVAAGSAGVGCISAWWIFSQSNAAVLAAMMVLRFVNVALSVMRHWACFAAIGFGLTFVTSALFVVAGSITTYVGVVPGGLGISEILSAALALIVDIEPSSAFLAAALNRITGLAMSGLVALILSASIGHKVKEAQ
ncbi:MAG: hypothetical protein AAFN04_03350 [Pseudomonadota bacterium]